ncbi:MAG: Long-chain-fatty-acid--CoA ligase [Candidatus Sulfotelmatobacter sp.]|nr:Long-chain-fatty-acid--CoA ligase [Candidatus Sulfotelmatobacter sp.]
MPPDVSIRSVNEVIPFIDQIFSQLQAAADTRVLAEIRDGQVTGVTGSEVLELARKARTFIASRGLQKGDRCGLLAANSIRWVALDLALMAEGLIVVPLYSRQAPGELVAMMKDCTPSLICCGDAALRDGISQAWTEAPPQFLFDEIFVGVDGVQLEGPVVGTDSPVTIIYTSGTSGEAKGVVLTAANVGFMLDRTAERLTDLMSGSSQGRAGQDRIFHSLPFTFAASWIALLTFLKRRSLVTINTDLTKIASDMRTVGPDYFLNVPQLLERMRRAVDEQLWQTGGVAQAIYARAKGAWARRQDGQERVADAVWLGLANGLVFPAIRKKMIGRNLRALICGSAPLSSETQLYFMMLGIRVLQVYGLTETTAICTMDDPNRVEVGRVGPAISGMEMKLGDNDEIVVRGPNVFSGYWNRPEQTAEALRGGWFHTGDQGEVNAAGNWRIAGRIKNLIILGSGHKISPEPIESAIAKNLPEAQQVVVAGNGRGYLIAIVTGAVSPEKMQAALDLVNPDLPHYKQVRAFVVREEAFSIESGMLTVNGKLKRDVIAAQMKDEIEEMYGVREAV